MGFSSGIHKLEPPKNPPSFADVVMGLFVVCLVGVFVVGSFGGSGLLLRTNINQVTIVREFCPLLQFHIMVTHRTHVKSQLIFQYRRIFIVHSKPQTTFFE